MPFPATMEPVGFTAIKHLMSSLIRRDEIDGEQYLVVPLVLITEGVHNEVLYTREELEKFPVAWNGVPIPVWHPDDDGVPISANDPSVQRKQNVGQVYGCEGFVNTNGLYGVRGEAWLRESKLSQISPEALAMLNTNKPIEVSTGLFSEDELAEGEWKGEAYSRIAHNIRPDHLALLPGGKGACSWKDGAGMPRINAAAAAPPKAGESWRKFVDGLKALVKIVPEDIDTNELSHESVRDMLQSKLNDKHPPDYERDTGAWVHAVFDDYFVYELSDRGEVSLQKQAYTENEEDNSVEFDGDPEEVQKQISFVPVTNEGAGEETDAGDSTGQPQNKETENMDKEKLVNALIENAATEWAEEDREALMALDEIVLSKMTPVVTNDGDDDGQEGDDGSVAEPSNNQSVEEYLAAAPAGIRETLTVMHSHCESRKASLVETLAASENCPFTKEQLSAKDVNELENLAAWVGGKTAAQPAGDFGGRVIEDPSNAITSNEDVEEPLELPSMEAKAS